MSDDYRFDQLGKALATSTSRRRFFKVAAAAAAAGVLSAVRAPEAAASHNRKCRGPGDNCTSNAQCCTHFCGADFHCACAVNCPGVSTTTGGVATDCCEPGDVCCPGGGTIGGNPVGPQCVDSSATLCPTGETFSSTTCRCEAVAPPAVACPSGNCRTNPSTCATVSGCLCVPVSTTVSRCVRTG